MCLPNNGVRTVKTCTYIIERWTPDGWEPCRFNIPDADQARREASAMLLEAPRHTLRIVQRIETVIVTLKGQ